MRRRSTSGAGPDRQRRRFEDLVVATSAEIGDLVGLTAGAVRVRLRRARGRCNGLLAAGDAGTEGAGVGHAEGRPASAGPGTEGAT